MRDAAARVLAVAVLCAALVSCQPNSPTEPSNPPGPPAAPTPQAQLVGEGALRWLNCTDIPGGPNTCAFEAMGRNVGTGCAQNVRGTIRFFISQAAMDAGQELASGPWSLVPTQKFQPNELFVFSGQFSRDVRDQTQVFSTEFQWDNVAC